MVTRPQIAGRLNDSTRRTSQEKQTFETTDFSTASECGVFLCSARAAEKLVSLTHVAHRSHFALIN